MRELYGTLKWLRYLYLHYSAASFGWVGASLVRWGDRIEEDVIRDYGVRVFPKCTCKCCQESE